MANCRPKQAESVQQCQSISNAAIATPDAVYSVNNAERCCCSGMDATSQPSHHHSQRRGNVTQHDAVHCMNSMNRAGQCCCSRMRTMLARSNARCARGLRWCAILSLFGACNAVAACRLCVWSMPATAACLMYRAAEPQQFAQGAQPALANVAIGWKSTR